jgi:K+-transporting ATPase KdpF subunit
VAALLISSLAIAFEGAEMLFDYILGGAVSVGLMVYLIYALIHPERF